MNLACFGDVVALARQEGDLQLAEALERNVRVERFEQGNISFSLVGNASSNIAQTLSRRLLEWTGERWMVAVKPSSDAATRHYSDAWQGEEVSAAVAALAFGAVPGSTMTVTALKREIHLLARRGYAIDLGGIPLDDARTYALLGRGEMVDVFQLESGHMRKALANSRIDRFDDLVALVVKFAGRGFNRSHATASALLVYWTAFLKANYSGELLAASNEKLCHGLN